MATFRYRRYIYIYQNFHALSFWERTLRLHLVFGSFFAFWKKHKIIKTLDSTTHTLGIISKIWNLFASNKTVSSHTLNWVVCKMLNINLENQYLLEQYMHGYTSFSQTFGQLLCKEKYFRTYLTMESNFKAILGEIFVHFVWYLLIYFDIFSLSMYSSRKSSSGSFRLLFD